jgi:hypothetical protein
MGSVYECLDCGESVPFYQVVAMQRQAALQASQSTRGLDDLMTLRTGAGGDPDEEVCFHRRVSQKIYQFYQRPSGPLVAHQCLECGEPVSIEEAARMRREGPAEMVR